MGSNPTQAIAIVLMLVGFTMLAGGFAGGGVILTLGAVAVLGLSTFFFLKCKPWETQND